MVSISSSDGQITKSNHSPKSQIIWQKDLNHDAKSQIKSHEIQIKSKSLEPKSRIKSNLDVNQMITVPDSIVYARNINLFLAWLSMCL